MLMAFSLMNQVLSFHFTFEAKFSYFLFLQIYSQVVLISACMSSFLALLGLRCCRGPSRGCGEQGLLCSCGGGLHSGVASLVVKCWLSGVRAPWRWCVGSAVVALGLWSARSVVVPHRLCCPKACGILPDEGSNPFSRTLTGVFFTTGPAERPSVSFCGY